MKHWLPRIGSHRAQVCEKVKPLISAQPPRVTCPVPSRYPLRMGLTWAQWTAKYSR